MSHTEGKLRVSGSNEMDTIEIWSGVERIANCNVSKAISYPTKRENARRLVACWNEKWADDEGGKPEWIEPEELEKARAILAKHQKGNDHGQE